MPGPTENGHPSSLSGVFGQPFPEQVAYFRQKLGNLVPTQFWDDMLAADHDTGFMVAGAMKADLLTDLAAAVDKAITEGRGIEDFRRDFKAIVAKHGWTGWTGEGSVKGEAWRVGVIYRTNSYTSYAAGRLAQLRASNFPFWVYRHGGSLEPRPIHLDWNGLILPSDHPFWVTHYPPSDWGCSCYVNGARSEAGARRLGGIPGKKLPANWNAINPKTGAPIGIGKGWNYAPGATVADAIGAIAPKLGSWDYQIAKAFMGELPPERAAELGQAYRALPSTADDVRRYAQRVYEPQPELAPLPPQRTLGLLGPGQAEAIEAASGKAVAGFDFSIDQSAIGHVIREHGDDAKERKHGQRGVAAADFARIPGILSDPDTMGPGSISDMGETVVEFRKVVAGETYHVLMAIGGQKRRTMALKTLFISVRGK